MKNKTVAKYNENVEPNTGFKIIHQNLRELSKLKNIQNIPTYFFKSHISFDQALKCHF